MGLILVVGCATTAELEAKYGPNPPVLDRVVLVNPDALSTMGGWLQFAIYANDPDGDIHRIVNWTEIGGQRTSERGVNIPPRCQKKMQPCGLKLAYPAMPIAGKGYSIEIFFQLLDKAGHESEIKSVSYTIQ